MVGCIFSLSLFDVLWVVAEICPEKHAGACGTSHESSTGWGSLKKGIYSLSHQIHNGFYWVSKLLPDICVQTYICFVLQWSKKIFTFLNGC